MSKVRRKSTVDEVKVREGRTSINKYELQRRLNIEANNSMLESLNLKRIRAPMTDSRASTKKTKRNGKQRSVDEDKNKDSDYEPIFGEDDLEDQFENAEELANTTKTQTGVKDTRKKSKFIAPLTLASILKINEKQRREMIGDDAAKTVCSAIAVLEEAISSNEDGRKEANVVTQDDIDIFEDFSNAEFDQFMREMEKGTDDHISNMDDEHHIEEESEEIREGQNENESNGDDVSLTGVECSLSGDKRLICVNSEKNTSANVRKKRGPVYCRKLTALAPGQKIFVDFNEDGIPIGENGVTFSYFLGEKVRNRAICPVQVNGWQDYEEDTLDRLWTCVLEICEFDDPNLRKEAVMKHARSLFRNGRYKLRAKYILTPNLTTKEEQLRNKPKDMLKADWKYLVDLWRTHDFQKKSRAAKDSRACQKMPHYTGSKSHARVKEELKKKNGRDCTRVDLLLETRKRKSKNLVNSTSLACNTYAIDEVSKKRERRRT